MSDITNMYAHAPMSKTAYRIHLLGMCVRIMRSFLFNVAVFFAGASIGMGFTVLKIQDKWQNSEEVKTFISLMKTLKHDIDLQAHKNAPICQTKKPIQPQKNK